MRVTGLIGIFTDPRHVVHYTSNDEVRQEFTVIYRAEYVKGDPTESDESTRVGWFTPEEVAELPMDPSQRKRLDWAVSRREPYIDPEGD